MATISLCMIVKNEEEVLHQCLSSVKDLCDEIVIVDTGSTDKTKEIAKEFTDKVIDFKWIDDFSAARNFAFSHATMDYILWIDADDVLLEGDQQKFKSLKENLDPAYNSYSMKYHLTFDEDGNPNFSFRRNRLVKREMNFKWIGAVHEYLEVYGPIYPADIAITHRKIDKNINTVQSDRNINIYEKRLAKGEEFTPRDLFYYANELKDHGQNEKAITYYETFLSTKNGWVEDNIRSCIDMAFCYRRLGDEDKEKESLVRSFVYDLPRPEVSCRMGDIYVGYKDYQKAAKWFQLAIDIKEEDHAGFKQLLYSTWYPHLQLCFCYWQLGEAERSFKHHKESRKYSPNDVNIKKNEEFFKSYLKDKFE